MLRAPPLGICYTTFAAIVNDWVVHHTDIFTAWHHSICFAECTQGFWWNHASLLQCSHDWTLLRSRWWQVRTVNPLRLLRTFAGVLGEKIRMRAILKENTANYISLESLINVDFGKKYKLPVSSIPQKKITINRENDHVSFNWINRVSNPSALAK